MMRAYILDDEQLAIDNLRTILRDHFPSVEIVGSTQHLGTAVEEISGNKIDILFLDIKLNNHDGFEIFEKIKKINFYVIFTTAYDEYAIKAIKYHALDYLLKPIDLNELKKAILKYELMSHNKTNIGSLYEHLVKPAVEKNTENGQEQPGGNRIILKHANGLEVLRFSDILYIQADGSYSVFHCKQHKKITYTKNSAEVEKQLPEQMFFRVHKSFIVNRYNVKSYIIHDRKLILSDGTELPVSRRKLDSVSFLLKRENF